MKTLLLALALLSAAPMARAQDKAPKPSLKVLDDKNGFRDMHFGDDISTFPTMKEVENDGNNKFYEKTDENLKIGDADLSKVTYGFYKGKLSFIIIRTEGITNSAAVLQALNAQYGQGFKSNPYMDKYSWLGRKVTMMYEENSINHNASIALSSREMRAQEAADEKVSAKKAASDL